MRKLIFLVLFIAILLASALFFSQNDSLVTVDYIISQFIWPLNWLIIAVFISGFIFGSLAVFVSLMSTKLQLAKSKRQMSNKDKEIKNLRSLPINDEY